MHMRKKHDAGTKQETERATGIRLRDLLLRDYTQNDLKKNSDLLLQIQHPSKLKERLNICDSLTLNLEKPKL